jgi:hypothetical protein
MLNIVHIRHKLKHDDARQRELRACSRDFIAKSKLSLAGFARLCKISDDSMIRFITSGGNLSDANFTKVTACLAYWQGLTGVRFTPSTPSVESNKGESDAAIPQQ